MKLIFRLLAVLLCMNIAVSAAIASGSPVSRAEGFLLIWRSIQRPAGPVRADAYSDVPEYFPGSNEINYARSRKLLDQDADRFYPDESLTLDDALLWIFRTRNVEPLKDDGSTILMEIADPEHVPALAAKYDVNFENPSRKLSLEELMDLMRKIDSGLAGELHEVSLYSEKFHGKGTAFGETFDMHALTAAHRSYPHNTLVRVTNAENGKSVVVRINDRGPFVQGRNMDLSLASFTSIAARELGKISAKFERLGDATLVQRCGSNRYQRRITRDVILSPGVPHSLELGNTLNLRSEEFFVVRRIVYPDGNLAEVQDWIQPSEGYAFTPSITGKYVFWLGTKTGRLRSMSMEVVECED